LLSLKFRWQQIICSRSNLTFVGRREEDQPYGWSSLMLLLFVEKQVGPCRGQCGRRSEDMEWGEEWWWWRSIDRRRRATGTDSKQQETNKKKRCEWEGIGSDLEQRAEVKGEKRQQEPRTARREARDYWRGRERMMKERARGKRTQMAEFKFLLCQLFSQKSFF
jgi:hypothetical protein